jgi:hypothetical protein
MVVCPYCGQDYVWEVSIRDLSGPLFMCLECDTVWGGAQEVKDGKGQNFEDFMRQRRRVADWKAIAKIKQIGDDS